MSHHDATRYPEYNTPEIHKALRDHRLAVDTPSQLSDSFRHGYRAAHAGLVADVLAVVQLVEEGEWAEHCTKTSLGNRLEAAVTTLHNDLHETEEAAEQTSKAEGDIFRALVKFLLEAGEPMAFLRCWNEGNFETCRHEWPEAPEAVYPTAPAGKGGV